jgi:hypothetical protein
MKSRLVVSALAVVLATASGCAVPAGADPSAQAQDEQEQTSQIADALEVQSLLDTAQAWGQKLGPVLGLASSIYGMYQDVPGKLAAMNAKLDTISSDLNALKTQVAAIDAKLDATFQADVVAPLETSEKYVSIDMKNQMDTLAAPGNEKLVNDWSSIRDTLDARYGDADTAGNRVLAYFTPDGLAATPASKYTPAQWYRIFGLELRAALAKVALRDAKATLASTYYDRAQTPEFKASRATAIADLVATVKDVSPQLRSLAALWVTARDVPGTMAQQCYQSGTWTRYPINPHAENTFPVESFRDVGGSYTSEGFNWMPQTRMSGCPAALDAYKKDLPAKVDAWVKANLNDPIAAMEGIPANWAAPL